jgi:UDP-glucose 4,6-dehydratase
VLLEACRAYGGVRRFVCVSTDEVYGDASFGALAGGALVRAGGPQRLQTLPALDARLQAYVYAVLQLPGVLWSGPSPFRPARRLLPGAHQPLLRRQGGRGADGPRVPHLVPPSCAGNPFQ